MKVGSIIISLDFELMWGLSGWDIKDLNKYKKNVAGSIPALKEILAIFREYNMNCTIAYVGAMLCENIESFFTYIPKTKPTYKNAVFSSYESILPYINNPFNESLFFCKDLINGFKKNDLIELASHTFSHYYCLEEGQNYLQFSEDCQINRKIASENGINYDSIILPRNQIEDNYLEITRKDGIGYYRGTNNSFLSKARKTRSRYSITGFLRFVDAYINLTGKQTFEVKEYNQKDLPLNLKGSWILIQYSNILFFLEPLKIRRIKKSMTYAAKKNENYHLWWHPHNFGLNMDKNLNNLKKICEHYKLLNSKYGYTSKKMNDF